MFALSARYRGRDPHRRQLVADVATALTSLEVTDEVEVVGAEDLLTTGTSATGLSTIIHALLSTQDWNIGIGVDPRLVDSTDLDDSDVDPVRKAAHQAIDACHRPGGQLDARMVVGPRRAIRATPETQDIVAAFTLISHLLSRRSEQGREATQLMRQGYTQVAAAEELGISKQAMSQRLNAAGWPAEQRAWDLTVRLLNAADRR